MVEQTLDFVNVLDYNINMRNGEYELVVAPEEYPGKKYRGRYCYEHHLVWWQNTKEIISKNEIVHHINKDKRDNKFSNLEKITVAKHNKIHAPGVAYLKMTCIYCNNKFYREKRQVIYKVRVGQKDFYCGRTCMAKHFGRGRSKH